MMHGDAHPGNFMLIGDKMGVIDFGAVALLPGGMPRELGQILRYAVDKNYAKLLPTMEKIGFIQKGERVSTDDVDEMLKAVRRAAVGAGVPLQPQVVAADGHHRHGQGRGPDQDGAADEHPCRSWRSRCG